MPKTAIISVEGEDGTTKSTILYTAPLPIVGFAFDTGTDRALYGVKAHELFKDADVRVEDWRDVKTPQDAKKLWQRSPNSITVFEMPQPLQLHVGQMDGNIALIDWVMEATGLALIDPVVRTLGYDTMTMLRAIAADAHLEKVQKTSPGRVQLQQIEYGKPNGVVRTIYANIKAVRKNGVVVHHLTDEMFDTTDSEGKPVRKPTGRRTLNGLSDTYEKVDIGVRMEKTVKNIPGSGGKPTTTEISILARMMRCGYNLGLESLTYPNPTWDTLVSWVEGSLGNRIEFEKRWTDE